MDLLSAGTSGGRVLIARHVSSDKALHVSQSTVNPTALCYSLDPPDVKSYISGLQNYGIVLWTCAPVVVLAILVLYCITLRAVIRHRPGLFSQAAFILAVYPVVAFASLIALLVPRARLLSEAISQQAVMLAMYQLFLFIVGDCGGVDQLVRKSEGARLETRVLPCCCWPCCIIPRPTVDTKRIFILRMLVLQMPIVQAILYIAILVIWAENPDLYQKTFLYFQPVVATSILTGVWGMVMCVRGAESAGFSPRAKFLALQLVLLIVKVQGGTVNFLPKMFNLPCHLPLTPTTYVILIHNSLTIFEMLLLAIWAWRLYRVPPSKLSDKIRQVKVVAVLEENAPNSLDVRNLKDGVDNKCFIVENRVSHIK